jgi:hypothetical protein
MCPPFEIVDTTIATRCQVFTFTGFRHAGLAKYDTYVLLSIHHVVEVRWMEKATWFHSIRKIRVPLRLREDMDTADASRAGQPMHQ